MRNRFLEFGSFLARNGFNSLTYSDGKLQVMAPTNAKPGRFTLYLYDSSSKESTHRASNKVDINVAPALKGKPSTVEPKKDPAKNSGEQSGNKTPVPQPPSVSFGSEINTGGGKLTELGLPLDVKPEDSRYINRVKKLQDCARLLETGRMSDALHAYLVTIGPIKANGDCPASGPAAMATSAGAGGTPMPKPPPIAAATPANSEIAKSTKH